MPYNPDLHHRRSIRLQGYDYTKIGVYFVTICTFQREALFGDVIDGQMQLNRIGQIITSLWQAIPHHFLNVELDKFVLMPNHLHGIVIIAKQEVQANSTKKRTSSARHEI